MADQKDTPKSGPAKDRPAKDREQKAKEAKKEAGTSNPVIGPGNGLPTI